MSDDGGALSGIDTDILVAWIFTIITILVLVLALVFSFALPLIGALSIPAAASSYPYYGYGYGYVASAVTGAILFWTIFVGIIYLVMLIPSILVLMRLGRMRRAVRERDIGGLKALNSTGWAVVALIFAGVIPGIMMLVAKGPIDELGSGSVAARADGNDVSGDSIERLSKLKALLDSGAITKSEFERQKRKLLGVAGGKKNAGADPLQAQLQELKELYDSGALDEDEYNAQKRRVLDSV